MPSSRIMADLVASLCLLQERHALSRVELETHAWRQAVELFNADEDAWTHLVEAAPPLDRLVAIRTQRGRIRVVYSNTLM